LATAKLQGLPENLANYVANFGIQDECQHAPRVFLDGKRAHLRLAVRLFCTSDMLQRAADAARTRKLPSEVENVDPQQKTGVQIAMEFKESFRQFCESIAPHHNELLSTELGLPNKLDDASNLAAVQFWLRFCVACLEFSADSTAFNFAEVAKVLDRFADISPSRLNCLEDFPVALPPGLVRNKTDKGLADHAMPDAKCVSTSRLFHQSSIGLDQTRDGVNLHRNSRKSSFACALSSSQPMFVKPDDGLIPIPNFLMARRKQN
jgi:hypothetical protein